MSFLRQRNIPLLGALVDSLVTSLPLTSLITFVSMQIVLYDTSIRPYVEAHIQWLSIWVFVAFMVVGVSLAMLVVFKYIIPSVWTFRNKQMFGYDSHVINQLSDVIERLERLEQKMDDRQNQELLSSISIPDSTRNSR